MAEKVEKIAKLRIPTGKATPAPPIGPALGQASINIIGSTKEFSARTAGQVGLIIPVAISVYEDRSLTFVTKTPPAAVLLKKAAKIERGPGGPNRNKVAEVSSDQVREIAELEMEDLNAADVEATIRMAEEATQSMGITVE